MTATERRYAGSRDEIISMEDLDVYGGTFEQMTFKGAMEEDPPILSDYKIITMLVSKEEVAELIKNNVFLKPTRGKWNKDIEAESLASLIALRKAMKKHRMKHAVSFHSNIARAKAFKDNQDIFTKSSKGYGKLDTFHVSGKTPTSQRSRVLENFESSKKALVTNARCLTEGVDVPNIDCVLFADPRRSTIDIVQAVGRALRKAEGKKFGYVIVPILAENTSGKMLEGEAFDTILMTLRALGSNDERIIEYFKAVADGKRTPRGPFGYEIDETIAKKIDVKEFAKEIELKVWSRLAKLSWRPFEEARDFARKLNFTSHKQWGSFITGKMDSSIYGFPPEDLPYGPDSIYSRSGDWAGWEDFLGTTVWSFGKARKFARTLGINSKKDYTSYCLGELEGYDPKPYNLPRNANTVYNDEGWKGWPDFLDYKPTRRERLIEGHYTTFHKARAFVRKLNLKGKADWEKYTKGEFPHLPELPKNIPTGVSGYYKGKGWKSWGDFLGTGTLQTQQRKYMPFREGRKFARSLKLNSGEEWEKYMNGEYPDLPQPPKAFPSGLRNHYINKGWEGWGDWLGTGFIAPHLREYKSYKQARKFAKSLNLKTNKEWQKFCNGEMPEKGSLPNDIPKAVDHKYKDDGFTWGDFLGTGSISSSKRKMRSFREARKFVRKLNLSSQKEWILYRKGDLPRKGKLPLDIPTNPNTVYINEWVSTADWLGTIDQSNFREFLPFNQARKFARRLGLKSTTEWQKFCNGELPEKGSLPNNIPKNPRGKYRNEGWVSMGDWLGTGFVASHLKKYRSFKEARKFARSLNLKTSSEWKMFCNGELPEKSSLPDDIPKKVTNTYKDKGWDGWPDFIGHEARGKKK